MRSGVIDAGLSIALIGLLSAIITVVFEKESNNTLTRIIYQDNNTSECIKTYPKIIFTDN